MEIIFESTGTTTGFENWLKSFNDVSNSLLVEIDLAESKFVAKTHTSDKTIVKYGYLPFDEAGFQAVEVIDGDAHLAIADFATQNPGRIFFGIFQQLDKFTKVANMYSGTENWKLLVRFNAEDSGRMVTTRVEFKSITLSMVVGGAEVDEFEYIDDDKFMNKIAKIDNPMVFEIVGDAIKMLNSVSSIYSDDPKKDIIDFTTQQNGDEWELRAIDHNGHTYNYLIGYLNAEVDNPVVTTLPVIRNNFLLATKKDDENSKVYMAGQDGASRIRIDTGSKFITIIASVRV